jgi:hypothetical protein
MVTLLGQSKPDSNYFISPVLHDIVLAGSFGELRSTHFHAGVDIKPRVKDRIGDSIVVVADGYVSRIKIQTGGYGQAVYIDHPNGHTSVYAHLDELTDTLASYVATIQRATQSYEVDLYPDSTSFAVRQGQYLGTMGNTGRSYAPHLHFEIRHTRTETPQDPCLWGIGAPDHKPPTLQSIGLEAMTPDLQTISQQIHYPEGSEASIRVPGWRVGIDVQAYDQMDGSTNRNGVYLRQIFVDDTLHWESRTDSIQWDETRYIRSYYDYSDKVSLNRTAVCAYVWPGSPLSIYTKKGGPIKLFGDQARKVEIVLTDLAGNTKRYRLSLLRADPVDAPPVTSYNALIRWDTTYALRMGRSEIKIDSATFDRDVRWQYGEEAGHIKLHEKTQTAYRHIHLKVASSQALDHRSCLVYHDDKRLTSYGGSIRGDTLTTTIGALGDYSIVQDTTPPTIELVQQSASQLLLRIDDNLATKGSAAEVKINVYIDGEWQITPYKVMTRQLRVPLDHLPAGTHQVMIQVTDDRGNESIWERAIEV